MDLPDPWRLDQQRSASGCAGRFRVLPFVADYVGVIQAQLPFEGGFDEQAGPRFAAWTMVCFVVRAEHDVIERKGAAEQIVHSVQFPAGLGTAREGRLDSPCAHDGNGSP